MPSDYGYINARLKGQHSKLLKAGNYEELLSLPDFEAFARWLASGPYSREWQEAQARYSGLAAAEEALSASFSSATRLMRRISEGRPRQLMEVIIRRWDLENLKAVVRGLHHRWPADEIMRGILPAGSLNKAQLSELAGQADLRELADTLSTWGQEWAVPLNRILPEYQSRPDLAALELTIDRYYYYQSLMELRGGDRDREVLRNILRQEIDLLNVRSLKRLRETGPGAAPEAVPDADRYYLPGGRLLTLEKYLALLDPKESRRALRSLRGTPLLRMLEGEEGLDMQDWQEKAGAYGGDPLGIEVAVGFLWRKYFEVVNLRLIARGKHFGLPADRIRQQLLTA
jgi:V/A-type H+-transporting ATPase subunit C